MADILTIGPFYALSLTTCPYCQQLIPPGEEVVVLQEPYPAFARVLFEPMHLDCFTTYAADPRHEEPPDAP